MYSRIEGGVVGMAVLAAHIVDGGIVTVLLGPVDRVGVSHGLPGSIRLIALSAGSGTRAG